MLLLDQERLEKFSGQPPGTLEDGKIQTCHAFIALLESTVEHDGLVQAFAENLEGPALDWFHENSCENWEWIREEFQSRFTFPLSMVEKVCIRQGLQQLPDESVQDFRQRCILAQFAIVNDNFSSLQDPAFERDVLLNFLLGLRPEIQAKVIASNSDPADGFFQEAIKVEKELFKQEQEIKEEENDEPPNIVLEDKLSCDICGRAVQDERKLDLHMLVRHRKNPEEFACDLCGKRLKTEDSLKKHVQFTCLKDRPVSCHLCQKPFIDNKSVRIHIASVHMKEKPHLCSECGKGFCTPTSLKTHRENVHEKLRKHVCKVCGKSFGNQGNLYVHNQRHHERYNFCCDTCGKQFCRPFELRRHMAVKHGEGVMPYPCTQCSKAFFEPKELKSHIAITHEGERPCSCPCCPETFTRKSAMRRHIKRKHSDVANLYIQKSGGSSSSAAAAAAVVSTSLVQ